MASTIKNLAVADIHPINKKDQVNDKVKFGDIVGLNRLRVVKGTYSFAVQGGAVGTIALKDENGGTLTLPSGAIIVHTVNEVTTSLTSGGSATIAITCQSAGDLVTATAVASWDAAVNTVTNNVLLGTPSTALKLTAERTVSAVVAVAALTAGVANIWVWYIEP